MRVRLIVSAALAAAATYSALIREAAPTLNRRSHRDAEDPPAPPVAPPLAVVHVTHVPQDAIAPAPELPVSAVAVEVEDPIAALARSVIERVGQGGAETPTVGSAAIDGGAETRLNRWLRAPVAVAGDVRRPGPPVAVAEREEVTSVHTAGPRLVPTAPSVDIATEAGRAPFRSRTRDGAELALAPAPVESTPEATPSRRARRDDLCDALVGPARRRARLAAAPRAAGAPNALIGSRPVRRTTTEETAMPSAHAAAAPLAEGRFALGAMAANPGDMTLTAVTFDIPVSAALCADAITLEIDSSTNMAKGGLRVLDGQGFAPSEDGFALMLTATEPGPFAVTGTYRVSA